MQVFEIHVGGEPVAQGRPRFTSAGGFVKAYDPIKSREFKYVIQTLAREKMAGQERFNGALCLYLTVTRVPPKSWAKYRRREAMENHQGIQGKPDLDNYIKIVLDALNGVVFADDACIVRIGASKRWSDSPGMYIRVVEDKV